MTEELQQKMLTECELNIHSIYNVIFCKLLLPKLKNKLNKKIVLIAKTKQFNNFFESCYSKHVDYFINYNEYTDYEVLEKEITEIIKTEKVDELYFVIPELFSAVNGGLIGLLFKMGFTNNYFYITPSMDSSLVLKNFKGAFFDIFNNKVDCGISCNVTIKGIGAEIFIEESNFKFKSIALSNNSFIRIEKIRGWTEIGWNVSDGAVLIIKDGCSFQGIDIRAHYGSKIIIGKDCMFSYQIMCYAGDGHPIFDTTEKGYGKRIFKQAKIELGDHVWVAYGVYILAGTSVGNGSIIGAKSLVNKKYPNNCVVAGNPARVVSKNRSWARNPNLTDTAQDVSIYDYVDVTHELE